MNKSQIEATLEWYFELVEQLQELKLALLAAIEKLHEEEE